MSIIAWDGCVIAADKAACNTDVLFRTTKLRRAAGSSKLYVLGWTGGESEGQQLASWWERGADPLWWPEAQKTDDWARLIVASDEGIWTYEKTPLSTMVEDPFCAWGSGRDFALAALYLGQSARLAVQVACRFSTTCGKGVDWFNLQTGESGVKLLD